MNHWARGFCLAACMSLLAMLAGCQKEEPNPVVIIDTSMGSIKAELYPSKAPKTVQNFLNYVDKKHFDGTLFHRVKPDFVIQGGGYLPGLREKPTDPPIRNESGNGLSNERGTLAMARSSGADTATSQFFINVKDNRMLDRAYAQDGVGYCVFGKVIEGMDVVDRIRQVKTSAFGEHEDVPREDVVIKAIRRVDGVKP